MPRLTQTDRARFSAAQLTEIDKLSSERLDEYITVAPSGSGMGNAEYKRAMIVKWRRKTPEQLRARVNLISVRWDTPGPVVTWATVAQGGDYTEDEKTSVVAILEHGKKYEDVAIRVAAGDRSIEGRVAALEQRV